MRKSKYILITVFFLIGFLIYPYIKVEILTYLYSKEFLYLEKDNYFLADYYYIKVFDYSKNIAQIYYRGGSIDLVTYIKKDGKWEHYMWETIWSSGTADDFTWPFYP